MALFRFSPVSTVNTFPFFVTLATSLALVLTQRWHGRLTLDSVSGVQKRHVAPTPRVGGIALALGLVAAYWVAAPPERGLLGPMALAAIPAFAAGLAEDLTKRVAVPIRLLATMSSGVLAWLLTGVAMQDTGLWGLDHLLGFTPLAVLFTAFVVGGVANATNIIDGFHGLASGVVGIMLAAMGFMALRVDEVGIAHLAFVLVTLALGFGAANWPGGRIFMGDGGAYLLGFLVAWVAILLPMRSAAIDGWATLLACAYPVIEALYTIRRRMRRRGHHPGQPDKCHLHHFIHRRVIRKAFPRASHNLHNSLTGAFAWLIAALPAAWAVAFCQNTPALIAGFFLAAFAYAAVFARLTQFVWCFQAATLRPPRAANAS